MRYRMEFRAKPSGRGAVRLVYTLADGVRETLGLGVSAHLSEWDTAKAFARPGTSAYAQLSAIRGNLDHLVTSAVRDHRGITSAEVMGAVMGSPGTTATKANDVAVDVWGWLHAYAASKGTSTASTYRAALVSYQRASKGATPTPQTLAEWNTAIVRGDVAPGTAKVYLSAVHAMLRRARRAGVVEWTAEVDRPTVPRKRGKIALSDAQVSALEGLPLRGELSLVRDLFLLGVYTSLRRSDWDIRTTDIAATKTNTKTKGTSLIADNPKLKRLLRKHRGHLSYSAFRMDAKGSTRTVAFDKLQGDVMAQLAEVCPELREVMPHRGRMVPKYRAIGSHSGRKSFISKHASGKKALPAATIMRATGHRSLAQLQAYIQDTVDDKETAKLFR